MSGPTEAATGRAAGWHFSKVSGGGSLSLSKSNAQQAQSPVLCMHAPPLATAPCSAMPNGQCATASFGARTDFVQAAVMNPEAQSQIGLHTTNQLSDREAWEFVATVDGGGIYCGRGPGWKVSSCGSIAKGDLLRLTRKADSVVMEKCKAAPPNTCVTLRTETGASSLPSLFPHVGIHNRATAVELCRIEPLTTTSWGLIFVISVLVGALGYFVGGFLYNRLSRGAPITSAGWRQDLPHAAMWRELASLCHDGWSFSARRLSGGNRYQIPRQTDRNKHETPPKGRSEKKSRKKMKSDSSDLQEKLSPTNRPDEATITKQQPLVEKRDDSQHSSQARIVVVRDVNDD